MHRVPHWTVVGACTSRASSFRCGVVELEVTYGFSG